jgi:hypothetical protein
MLPALRGGGFRRRRVRVVGVAVCSVRSACRLVAEDAGCVRVRRTWSDRSVAGVERGARAWPGNRVGLKARAVGKDLAGIAARRHQDLRLGHLMPDKVRQTYSHVGYMMRVGSVFQVDLGELSEVATMSVSAVATSPCEVAAIVLPPLPVTTLEILLLPPSTRLITAGSMAAAWASMRSGTLGR